MHIKSNKIASCKVRAKSSVRNYGLTFACFLKKQHLLHFWTPKHFMTGADINPSVIPLLGAVTYELVATQTNSTLT
jgi:hypothetical protein